MKDDHSCLHTNLKLPYGTTHIPKRIAARQALRQKGKVADVLSVLAGSPKSAVR